MAWQKINFEGKEMMIEVVNDPNEVTRQLLNSMNVNTVHSDFAYYCTLLSCHLQKPMIIYQKGAEPVEIDESKFK
jgi:hypothetical protein